MSRRLAGCLLLAIALSPATATAETIEERFQEANGHYYREDFANARAAYEALAEQYHIRNAVLFYNLGNAHYMLSNPGRAILSYKRALEAEPDDALEAKIRDNLERCVEALIDRHRKDVGSVTVLDETHGVAYSIFQLVPPNVLAALFALLWLAFFAVLCARLLSDDPTHRRALRTTLAALLFVGNAVTSERVERGIVVQDNVQMRDGKHPDAPASDVPEGLEVRIIDTTDPNETRIRLSNGKEGWVPAESVEAI